MRILGLCSSYFLQKSVKITEKSRLPAEISEKLTAISGLCLVLRVQRRADSARGVAAIVVWCRNSSCNSSCDAIACRGSKNYCIRSAVSSAMFDCNSSCEGTFQTCFKCGRVLQSHTLPTSPFFNHPKPFHVHLSDPLDIPDASFAACATAISSFMVWRSSSCFLSSCQTVATYKRPFSNFRAQLGLSHEEGRSV